MQSVQEYFKENHNITLSCDEIECLKELILKESKKQRLKPLKNIKEGFDGIFGFDISIKSKKRKYIDARELFCHFAVKKGFTREEIGAVLNLHHSTVTYFQKKHQDDVRFNASYRIKYNQIKTLIN